MFIKGKAWFLTLEEVKDIKATIGKKVLQLITLIYTNYLISLPPQPPYIPPRHTLRYRA